MAYTDFPRFKLGKLSPRLDGRTLHFQNYAVLATLAAPPPSAAWTPAVTVPWGMMENDTLGDCTCAAAGHMIECWTSNVAPPATYVPPDTAIVTAYSAVSGYNPATGQGADNGAVVLNMLNYWRQTGVSGHTIAAYMALETGSHLQVQQAVYFFGGCYIGVQLPISAQNQPIWAVPPGGPVGQGAPASWGKHAIPILGYDVNGLTVITWGEPLVMTWGFFDAYCDEAYAILSKDWFNTANVAPDGFNYDALQADLNQITGGAPLDLEAIVSAKRGTS